MYTNVYCIIICITIIHDEPLNKAILRNAHFRWFSELRRREVILPALFDRVMGPGTGDSLGTGKMGLSIVDVMGVWSDPLLVVRREVGKTGLRRLATGV